MKVAVVTACFGGMDEPKPFPAQTVPCDRLVFDEANSPYPLAQFSDRMKAKFFKLQTHKIVDADCVIWIDGNVQIKSATFVEEILRALGGTTSASSDCDIAITKHPERGCIYQEAKFITESIDAGNKYLTARYGEQPITQEADHYARRKHPANFGLWWCGLFARPVNKRTNTFFDAWWDEVLRWSSLDQSSFAFLVRKFDIKIREIGFGDYYENATYKLHSHRNIQ
jgi:hypothetical protein